MKKIISLLLALTMTVSLVACSSASAPAEEAPAATEATEATEATTEETAEATADYITSDCGFDNPGSIPGVSTFFPPIDLCTFYFVLTIYLLPDTLSILSVSLNCKLT